MSANGMKRSDSMAPLHRSRGPTSSNSDAPSQAASVLLKRRQATENQSQDNSVKLSVSLDYGTKTLASAIFLVQPSSEPTPENVHNVNFGTTGYWAPQLAAWDKDKKFYWGCYVEKAIARNLLEPDDVISLWKMLLYRAHASTDIGKRIKTQMGSHTLEELLSTHIREVLLEVKEWIKKSPQVALDLDNEQIDALPVELFLSVPQMWKAPANQMMTTAAMHAGVDHTELVYEPQCAAGYFTARNKNKYPRNMNSGHVLLVADLGGGTGDFVSLELMGSADDGAKVLLKPVGTPEGKMCGSEMINEECLQWLRAKAEREEGGKGFEGLFTRLKISEAAGIAQAMAQFESHKHGFITPDQKPSFITIRGDGPSWEARIEG